eukprot:TRINITY_DN82418_c0_g1_i1.p1 TRINITY_DN82418_c0_g1~~TRINITY_DN82418_c0_g1_i1.p1  ORF type:complete len:201 (+),score=41.05 TRINITY_DN82418_c0_g1_i1:30-605(+)
MPQSCVRPGRVYLAALLGASALLKAAHSFIPVTAVPDDLITKSDRCVMLKRRSLSMGSFAAALGLRPNLACADEVDDEVSAYIAMYSKKILRNEKEQERFKQTQLLELPEYKDVPSFVLSNSVGIGGGGGQEFMNAQEEFAAKKYLKMKERVINAKTPDDRAKALRVMKAEALKDSVRPDQGWLLKEVPSR